MAAATNPTRICAAPINFQGSHSTSTMSRATHSPHRAGSVSRSHRIGPDTRHRPTQIRAVLPPSAPTSLPNSTAAAIEHAKNAARARAARSKSTLPDKKCSNGPAFRSTVSASKSASPSVCPLRAVASSAVRQSSYSVRTYPTPSRPHSTTPATTRPRSTATQRWPKTPIFSDLS